jgi:cyanophycinase
MRRSHLFTTLLAVVPICGIVTGQPPASVVKEPFKEIAGTLFIVGGGNLSEELRADFIKRAGASDAKLVVIPTASATADGADAVKSLEQWKKYGVASLTLFHTRDRKKANDPAFVKPLTEATAVWLGGGDQSKITEAYLGTAVAKELKSLLSRSGVIGGTSAGAAVMSEMMITGGNPVAKTGKGFGFVSHFIVDQHFFKRERGERLIGLLAKNPGLVGIGIDESTAAIIKGRTLTVRGKSYVVTILSKGGSYELTQTKLKDGDTTDLIALSRSAIARTTGGTPVPPAKPTK